MPPIERDAPALVDRTLRHQHSASSDQGRALIPMWDSADPERAPPPLPLNPQSPAGASRPGTSTAIQTAHAALTERARESQLVSGALAKRMTGDFSPEKSPLKNTHTHRRMQSLGPGVRDLSLMIEGSRESSPEKSLRPSTPSKSRDPFYDGKPEDKHDRALMMSPSPGPSLTPIVRPTAIRRSHQSILGENTPPQSATMLALQNMSTPSTAAKELREPDSALSNVTNNSTALVRPAQSMEALSGQLLHITNIATALQKEMNALSRRSRDNATDLMSLKEASRTRDENIHKSLREAVAKVNAATAAGTRDQYGGSLLLDDKPFGSVSPPSDSDKTVRPFLLPRIPSQRSFAASMDRESLSTPSLSSGSSHDDSTRLALLETKVLMEKILREMGTRANQDLLVERLTELSKKLGGSASAEKVDELVDLVKQQSKDNALVPGAGGDGGMGGGNNVRNRTAAFDDSPSPREIGYGGQAGPMMHRVERLLHGRDDRRASAPAIGAPDVLNDDVLKAIRGVKDSVAQGGGLTAEVKALVRELRGEVLGMGRELGRRLEEVGTNNESDAAVKDEITKVVEDGLLEMKKHMNELLREHRRQSAQSIASRAPTVDYNEIYNAMRTALKDSQASKKHVPELSRADVIDAVRDAWEQYKPEIAVEQIGLEREEVLACLKEGLQDYTERDEDRMGATRDEVFTAVVEGLKHFVPPQVDTPASLSRDEILEAVRECLEEFEFPVAPSAIGGEVTREDMAQAVKDGLADFEFPQPQSPLVQRNANNDEIVIRLHEIMEFMQQEFKSVSDEAKQNVAANGRDTEQVLDATKDGIEKLRADIEGYVDRAAGAAGQEEFLEGLVRTLDLFREEISGLVSQSAEGSRDMLKSEIESLRDTVNGTLVPHTPPTANNQEILQALQDGLSGLRNDIRDRPIAGTNEVLDALQEGLGDLRACIERMSDKPIDLTANDEILDALKSGLSGVRSDIDGLKDSALAVATMNDNPNSTAVIPTDIVKHDDIKNLEVLITQLRIKVEAMDGTPPPTASKENLSDIEEMLRDVQEKVSNMSNRPAAATDAATREDVQAIETILRNTKDRLDDLIDGEQAVRKDHIDALEGTMLSTKESLAELKTHMETLSTREDLNMVESVVAQVANSFDEMKERHEKQLEDPERVTKTDVDAVEAVCLDIQKVVDQMMKSDIATLSSKDDIKELETLMTDIKTRLDTEAEANSKAIEVRTAETATIAERVTEVKAFLEELQTTVKDKLEEGTKGVDSLGKILETLAETIEKNGDVSIDVKTMFDAMKVEFEESKAGVVGAKLESDEKFQLTTDTLSTKIDERFDALMTKYDDFQAAQDARAKLGEARDAEMEAAVVGSKAIADELKTLIDALGLAVTDSLEKMEEASKTVFTRVEDLVTKSDENHSDNKAEHQQTRDELKQTLTVAEGIQGHVVEYQPKILESIKDVLAIVGQHYEHSKGVVDTIQEKIEEAKPPEVPLLPPPEPYDDTGVHEKLNKLVDHTETATTAFAQLDTLDKIHAQVLATQVEFTSFIASSKQRIEDEHEDREKALAETSAALERKLGQKDEAERVVSALKDEETLLRQSIAALRAEQADLSRNKTRLTADVSSLETALRIRRDELHDMEGRAEGLERRILEGVMDHSRVLLMAKQTKAARDRDMMSRKRVPSSKPAETKAAPAKAAPSKPRAAFNMAMGGNRNLAVPGNAARRILSLSQINQNVSTTGFKRSQSVRTNVGAGMRKASWAAGRGAKGYGELNAGNDLNKENAAPLKESDEEAEIESVAAPEIENQQVVLRRDPDFMDDECPGEDSGEEVDESQAVTVRRISAGTTVVTGTGTELGTDDDFLSDEESKLESEWTESQVGVQTPGGAEMTVWEA